MPHTSLLVVTSPFVLGTAPLPATIAIEPVTEPIQSAAAPAIMPLSWSMAQETDPDAQDTASDEENEIVVEGEYGPIEADPMGEFNAESYRITQELDEVFVEPVAYAYRDGLPDPLRDGLGNVVRNLSEPSNFLNYLLQFKFGKAFETLGRFAINSTLGLGGLFDIAAEPGIGLPYRRNGFANTLGYYGVEPGAYLYLPVTGATTVRDLIGNGLDQFVLPVAVGRPFNTPEYAIPYFVISSLDARLEVDAELARIDATIDPYAARRDSYLYRRERDIAELRGEEPPPPPSILEEVEGTGEFSEDFEEDMNGIEPSDAPAISYRDTLESAPYQASIAITRPRTPSARSPESR